MTILEKGQNTNVSERERLASLIGGGSLMAFGMMRRDFRGLALAAVGGGLMLRGATGHCGVYKALGVNGADEKRKAKGTGRHVSIPYELGIRVDYSIHIDKSPEELFKFWRNLENLPKFMEHLESVRVRDDKHSHWSARGPARFLVEWDAEIISEVENRLIGWRSLEGSDVQNAGSVRFESSQHGLGTRVWISLQYNPPAGALGAAVAKLLGEDPKLQIEHDMKRFKELMEKGRIQPSSAQKAKGPGEPRDHVWDRDAVSTTSEDSFPASDPPAWTSKTV